jgi:hypothetical protein
MTKNLEVNLILAIMKTGSYGYSNPKLKKKGTITSGDRSISINVDATNYEKANILNEVIEGIDNNSLTDAQLGGIKKILMNI